MNKKEARKKLGVDQVGLADLLCVNTGYLNGLKVLSTSHIAIINGALDKRKLRVLLAKVDELEKKCQEYENTIDTILFSIGKDK